MRAAGPLLQGRLRANAGANAAAAVLKQIERNAADCLFGECDTSLVQLAEELERRAWKPSRSS